jgi:hypothetical protein
MLDLFKRLFDPITHRQEQTERKRQRDTREDEGNSGAPPPPLPVFACRICDYRSTNPEYCPTCLADTMIAVP